MLDLMLRVLFLLGLLPVILGIVVRKWYGERILGKVGSQKASLTGEGFLARLLVKAELPLVVKTAKRTQLKPGELVLSRNLATSQQVDALAEVGLLFGLALLGKQQPQLPQWHAWALRFSWAFPSFLMLVMVFAAFAGFFRWFLPLVSLGLGLGALVGFLAAWVEWQAATRVGQFLASRIVLSRDEERFAVTGAMRALATRRCVPGLLNSFFR